MKRNNYNEKNCFRKIKGNWYYRLMVWNGSSQTEWTIPMKTKVKDYANRQYKDEIKPKLADVKDGTMSKMQFMESLSWINKSGKKKEYVDITLEMMVTKYLNFKKNKVRASSLDRDRISLNQLMECLGYSFNVKELQDGHIDDKDGFIDFYQSKGYKITGINISLRSIKCFTKWLHKKAKVISEPIEFSELKEYYEECFVDEHQMKEIYNYIDDASNGIDGYFKRALMFYELTGCRAIEPFIAELYGDWLYIQADKSKGGSIRKIRLNNELKSIWHEMYERMEIYTRNGSKRPSKACYERIAKTLRKIVEKLGINSRKISLKSFRHQYAIKRVFITGNVHQVAMEMGHSQITTTQRYLRFQPDELLQYFPSLQSIIKNMEEIQKSASMVTKSMVTKESSNINFHGSYREKWLGSSVGRAED